MNKYKQLGVNTVLVFVGNVGSKLISLLMLPLYTKWLSVEDYGTTDIINVYVSLLLGIVTCSIFSAIFVFPKGAKLEKQKSYFSSGLIFSLISLIITAVVFLICNSIFSYLNVANSFIEYIWVIYALLVVMVLQNYTQQFTRSIGRMAIYSITGIVMAVCTALFSIFFIPKYGVYGYLYALIVANFISFLYVLIFSRSYKFISIHLASWNDCKSMLKYSIPLIPNDITWWLVGALNRPIMEAYIGMNAIGLYAVANKLPTVMGMIYTIFAYSWQISVLEEFKKEGYKEFYNRIFRLLFVLLIVVSCILAICSEGLISVIADDKFHEAWVYVPVLTIAIVFSSISGFVGANFSATRESKYYFYSSVSGAVISIILNFVLIPYWGVWGAVLSVVFSQIAAAITRLIFSWRYVQLTNISTYVFMIFINVSIVLIMLLISSLILKTVLIIVFFVFLIAVNRQEIQNGFYLVRDYYNSKK